MISSILQFAAGALLLGAGKKLYWFVVGLCGALVGLVISEVFFHPIDFWERALVAIGFGVVFAILALVLQKIMVGIAGFISGGFILVSLAKTLQLPFSEMNWMIYILGGVIGVLLVRVLFDLALILISSFAGATLILRTLELDGAKGTILLLVLVLIGIVIQSTQNKIVQPAPPPATK